MKRFAIFLALTALAAGSAPALAGSPSILVAPNQVFVGQTANVYGMGFCPDSVTCSAASVAVDETQVTTVRVGSDGKFHATFVVNQFSGTHVVSATQPANGQTLQARTFMMVPLTDNRRTSPTPPSGGPTKPPPAQPAASQPPNPAATASNSPVADSSPAPQSGSTAGAPLSSAPAVAANPLIGWGRGIGLLVLVAVVAAVVAWVVWRRRRESV